MGGLGSGGFHQNPQQAGAKLVRAWREDMACFVDQAILAPTNAAAGTHYRMTAQQLDGAAALTRLIREKQAGRAQGTLGLSIMSGKGTGKDAFAAWAICWFLSCFSYPKVPCVSVSADQLNKVLWSELAKWIMHSPLREQFRLQNDKLFCATLPDEARGKRWLAFPKAANPKDTFEEQVETLAGIHERHLLQVVDEGSGVLDNVFQVLEGNQTGEVNLMLLIFNPNRSKGYAVETQGKHADRWTTLRWNAEDSELVDRAAIARMAEDYGRDSNTYRVRVLGLPPLADAKTLIPWDWIEEAVGRPLEPVAGTPLVKGVDCGSTGDQSVIATRRGPVVYKFLRNRIPDATALANWIGTDIDADRPDVVRVDTIGLGHGIESMLREKKGAIVEAADVRRMADEPDRFLNKRAEMYWRLREAFERGAISLPDDPELQNQLGALRCEYDNKGRVKIVEKKALKREIGHSPDEADALALTYFYPDALASKATASRWRDRRVPRAAGESQAWMGT